MARPVTTLVVFFVAFNLFAGMIAGAGIDSMLGLDATVGEDEEVNETVKNSEEIKTGTGLGDTLGGMYNVLAGTVRGFFDLILPGLAMLRRAGVPPEITDFLNGVFTFMAGIAVISFVRGWDL